MDLTCVCHEWHTRVLIATTDLEKKTEAQLSLRLNSTTVTSVLTLLVFSVCLLVKSLSPHFGFKSPYLHHASSVPQQ